MAFGAQFVKLFLAYEVAFLAAGFAGIKDDVSLKINDPLQTAGGHVENGAHSGRHGLEEPDVGDGHGQLNVAHTLAPDLALRDFHAAAVADDAFVFNAFVLTAGALPVFHRAENVLAEKAAGLGFVSAVVDGLGVFDFAVRPGADSVGGSDVDSHFVKLVLPDRMTPHVEGLLFLGIVGDGDLSVPQFVFVKESFIGRYGIGDLAGQLVAAFQDVFRHGVLEFVVRIKLHHIFAILR